MDSRIESYLKFLIERHLIDNTSESETLTKYLELFETFDD